MYSYTICSVTPWRTCIIKVLHCIEWSKYTVGIRAIICATFMKGQLLTTLSFFSFVMTKELGLIVAFNSMCFS